jgi:plastocyanin
VVELFAPRRRGLARRSFTLGLIVTLAAGAVAVASVSAGWGSRKRQLASAEGPAVPLGASALISRGDGVRWIPALPYYALVSLALVLTASSLLSVAALHHEAFMFPVGGMWLAGAVFAATARRWWGGGAGIVLGIVGLYAGLSAFRFGLPHPDSAADFAPAITALVGCICSLGFGAAAFERRFRRRDGGTRSGVAIFGGALTIVLALTIASILVTLTGRESVSASERAGATPIAMHNIQFEPATIDATAGTSLRLVVHNDDMILHNFTVPDAGLRVEIGPGSDKVIFVPLSEAGEYAYLCTVPGHVDMRGTIVAR